MSLEIILSQILEITTTFNPKIAFFLFFICTIGEAGFSIPYLLETVWLMTGYHVTSGILPPADLLLIWITAQAGRQTGMLALYSISRFGSTPLLNLYRKYLGDKVSGKRLPFDISRRLDNLSPFSVAAGRLFGLRIPISLTLGVKRKLPVLSQGVVLSSLIWDGIYLSVGCIVGATAVVKPVNMFLYSLAGLTLLYSVTLASRAVVRYHASRRRKVAG